MPTNMFQSRNVFSDAYNIVVLKTMEGLRSPGMLTIDPASVSADPEGAKIVRPGAVIVSGNGAASGLGRILPASTATAAVTTAQAAIPVADAASFKVGDVLVTGAPGATSAVGTIASINTVTRTITLAANATTALASGAQVWVNVAQNTIKGIVVRPTDLLSQSNDVAYYVAASVFTQRMPFWNSLIQAQLPGVVLD